MTKINVILLAIILTCLVAVVCVWQFSNRMSWLYSDSLCGKDFFLMLLSDNTVHPPFPIVDEPSPQGVPVLW